MKETMSKTLVDYYGINFQNEYNRAVTDAWDKAQERVSWSSNLSFVLWILNAVI